MRQPALRRGRPVWLDGERSTASRYPILRGSHQADVAIVGAGMTGAMIAAIFSEAGVPVIAADAGRAGLGSTAASTALLLQEPDYDLSSLGRIYGTATARRIWQLSHDATREFVDTIRRLRIECRLQHRASVYYTIDDEQTGSLRREWRRRVRGGFRSEWLEGAAAQRAAGVTCAAAMRSAGNAQLNPLLACRGLLDAACDRGARVFERSAVNRIRRTADGVRLYTPHGTIDARQAVIATGYATKYFRPLAGHFTMRHTYVLATEPIGWRVRHRLGLGQVLLWDTARPYHYVRWTDDRRLLLGGEDRRVTTGPNRSKQFAEATRELRGYFNEVLPGFSDVRIARAWEGLFAMTPDGLPLIGPHRRYPGHTFALGYGGNGMTFAALAARILLEQWNGIDSADHQLFAFNRTRRRSRQAAA